MKFLNIDGLSHFLDKTKTWVDGNYYGKDTDINIDNGNIEIGQNDAISSVISSTGLVVHDTTKNKAVEMGASEICVRDNSGSAKSTIYSDSINSPKFVKIDGKETEVLLANGDVAELDKANGIPTLNEQGKIDASKVDIDTTLFEVVTELPSTTDTIIKNRIYLKVSAETDPSGKNIYSEYIYTGDLSTDYDEAKWEKLGEYKSEVDLSGYSTKEETLIGFNAHTSTDSFAFILQYADNTHDTLGVPIANQEYCGIMSSSQVSKLNNIANNATADEALSNDDIDTLFA